jgi:hypothetical protein
VKETTGKMPFGMTQGKPALRARSSVLGRCEKFPKWNCLWKSNPVLASLW